MCDFSTFFPQRVALEIFPPGKSPYCGRHFSQTALHFCTQHRQYKRRISHFLIDRLLVKLHGYRATIKGSYKATAISSVLRCLSATFWCKSSTKVRKILFVVSYLVSCKLQEVMFGCITSDINLCQQSFLRQSYTETLDRRVHCITGLTAILVIELSTLY